MLQTFRNLFISARSLLACWGRVFCSISFYSGELVTVFNCLRHAFARSGTLQKPQQSVSRYFDDLIQLFCGGFEEEKATPKTEWQAQDSGYSPSVEGPHNGDSWSHCFIPLCLPQRYWDGAFFPALWLPALPAACPAFQVSFPLMGPGAQGSAL